MVIFLKSDTWARTCTMLASIAMQKIKIIYSSLSEKMSKNLIFLHLIPCHSLDYFFWNPTPGPHVVHYWPLRHTYLQSKRFIVGRKIEKRRQEVKLWEMRVTIVLDTNVKVFSMLLLFIVPLTGKCQKNSLTLNPLLIPGLLFFETKHLAQMLHSVGPYHHAKYQRNS